MNKSFKWLNLLFESSLGLMNGAKDMEVGMDWGEAWGKWSSFRNQVHKAENQVDQSVIHLFSCVSSPKEMVTSDFCESQRERKPFKWASNCGLEEMPYKKSMSNFPLTSKYTQHISTSNQNINILLDFKCPLTAVHIACVCSLPGIFCDSWQKYKRRPPFCGQFAFFPSHLPPCFTRKSLSHMEWTPISIYICPQK